MDKIIQIFTKLGVDQSIFIQFFLFAILFLILKVLLFDKLLFVIQIRESKTTKLESEANRKEKEAESLSREFEEKMQKASESIYQKASEKKAKALKEIASTQKEKENQIFSDYEEKKESVLTSIKASEREVFSYSDGLAEDLIDKISN